MTITQLVEMAERIHDAEGHNLGANSTRETRNAFWMRVVGCAHWGHPVYNPTPDPRWHVKDGGGGRPMSDDVAVLMPSREAWDCIPGAGANGYRFEADHIGVLPAVQNVYPPTRPSGGSGSIPTKPQPPAPVLPPYPGDDVFDQIGVALFADYALAGQPPNPGMGRWIGRVVYDYLAGMSMSDSIKKHRPEWKAALGLP